MIPGISAHALEDDKTCDYANACVGSATGSNPNKTNSVLTY